jgi:multidrug transporter EmrE-like cation transporter
MISAALVLLLNNPWFYMMLAIAFELVGTNCAKLSTGLRMLKPTFLMYVTYGISVSCLAVALNNNNINNNGNGGGAEVGSGLNGDDNKDDDVAVVVVATGGAEAVAPVVAPYGLDLGAAYAAWSGIGTIVAALLGVFLYGETLVVTQVIGIVLTIVGVTMVNLVPPPCRLGMTGGGATAVAGNADGSNGRGDGVSLRTAMDGSSVDASKGASATNYGSFDGINYTKI